MFLFDLGQELDIQMKYDFHFCELGIQAMQISIYWRDRQVYQEARYIFVK